MTSGSIILQIKWFYQGPGANFIFPEAWSSYEEAIPVAERGDYLGAYGKRLRGELGEEEMKKAAKAWLVLLNIPYLIANFRYHLFC